MSRRLTLEDVADVRAYEREREAFRARVIAMKKDRRIAVGPVVSLVFENRDTIRFQIQEMARAERLASDEAIQVELDTYNPLIPEPGELSASMYIELTSRAEMEQWLPRLVGVEQAVELHLGGPGPGGPGPGGPGPGPGPRGSKNNGAATEQEVVRCEVDPSHAANLTRQEVTAAVHFVRFSLTPAQVERFRRDPVEIAIVHPNYQEATPLTDATRAALLEDLAG